MIKANELRIGNWVYSPIIDGPFQISSLTTDHDPSCNAIPLTPEVLVECGFGEVDDMIFVHDEKSVVLLKLDEGFHLGDLKGQPYSIALKYLHQLQNLYWILVGEELIHQSLK